MPRRFYILITSLWDICGTARTWTYAVNDLEVSCQEFFQQTLSVQCFLTLLGIHIGTLVHDLNVIRRISQLHYLCLLSNKCPL